MAPVTHIVRHPHWQGDHRCVCTRHIDWAKTQLHGELIVKKIAPCDCTTGCVCPVGDAQLKRRMARA